MSQKPQPSTRPPQSGPGSKKPGAGPTPGPGGSKPAGRGDVERALLLRDVMDHAVKVHKEITAPGRRRESHARATALGLLTAALLAFSVYSWLVHPAFIWGPTVPPPPAAEQEAGYRFSMVLLAQRVEAYRLSEGIYPASLEAIGEGTPDFTYAVVGDAAFELRATVNGKQIVFRSDQSVEQFLGNSTNIIQGFGPK